MKDKPNILILCVDQQRLDCLGYSEGYPVLTPNIDRLSKGGIRFNNAYTTIPVCCPSRQSFLNGRRAEAFGALWNYDNGLITSALGPEEYTWIKDLKKHGYHNCHVGQWHINPQYGPNYYGFDESVSDKDYMKFRKAKYPEAAFTKGWMGEIDPVPVEDSATHWLCDRTIDLIKSCSKENSPWYITLDFLEPHLPCRPAGRFSSMYDPKDIPQWTNLVDNFINKPYIQKQQLYNWEVENYTWEDWAPVVARYYGVISQVDDAIGNVLKTIEEMSLEEDTIIIYTSDHGDMCGAHGMVDKHYIQYDDVVRVPLIVKWKGSIEEGLQNDNFVYNCLDLAPTILDILGIEKESIFHGKSLLPFINGKLVENWRTEVITSYNGQQFGLYTQRMIRNIKWKYVWNTTDVDELYDMEKDPDELINLIYEEDCNSVLLELRKKLFDELVAVNDGIGKNPMLKRALLNNRKN